MLECNTSVFCTFENTAIIKFFYPLQDIETLVDVRIWPFRKNRIYEKSPVSSIAGVEKAHVWLL